MLSTFWGSATCPYSPWSSPTLAGSSRISSHALSSLQAFAQFAFPSLLPTLRILSEGASHTSSGPPLLGSGSSGPHGPPSPVSHLDCPRFWGASLSLPLTQECWRAAQKHRCTPETHQRGARTGPWSHSRRRHLSQTSCSPSRPPPPPCPGRTEGQGDKQTEKENSTERKRTKQEGEERVRNS